MLSLLLLPPLLAASFEMFSPHMHPVSEKCGPTIRLAFVVVVVDVVVVVVVVIVAVAFVVKTHARFPHVCGTYFTTRKRTAGWQGYFTCDSILEGLNAVRYFGFAYTWSPSAFDMAAGLWYALGHFKESGRNGRTCEGLGQTLVGIAQDFLVMIQQTGKISLGTSKVDWPSSSSSPTP